MATKPALKAHNVSSVVRIQLLAANKPISSARIAMNGGLDKTQQIHVTAELATLRRLGFIDTQKGHDPEFKTTKLYSVSDKAAMRAYCFGE
jgi:hypothetical protein